MYSFGLVPKVRPYFDVFCLNIRWIFPAVCKVPVSGSKRGVPRSLNQGNLCLHPEDASKNKKRRKKLYLLPPFPTGACRFLVYHYLGLPL